MGESLDLVHDLLFCRHQHSGNVHGYSESRTRLNIWKKHTHTDGHKYDKTHFLSFCCNFWVYSLRMTLFRWFWWYLWHKLVYKMSQECPTTYWDIQKCSLNISYEVSQTCLHSSISNLNILLNVWFNWLYPMCIWFAYWCPWVRHVPESESGSKSNGQETWICRWTWHINLIFQSHFKVATRDWWDTAVYENWYHHCIMPWKLREQLPPLHWPCRTQVHAVPVHIDALLISAELQVSQLLVIYQRNKTISLSFNKQTTLTNKIFALLLVLSII